MRERTRQKEKKQSKIGVKKENKVDKLVKSKLCFVVPMYDIAIASKRQFGNFVTDVN